MLEAIGPQPLLPAWLWWTLVVGVPVLIWLAGTGVAYSAIESEFYRESPLCALWPFWIIPFGAYKFCEWIKRRPEPQHFGPKRDVDS